MSYTRINVIEPCYAELGEWMAVQRKKLGLLQSDVADLLAISRPAVANIESGNQRVLHHTALLIREALVSKAAFNKAKENREAREEDNILIKAEQIKRRRAGK